MTSIRPRPMFSRRTPNERLLDVLVLALLMSPALVFAGSPFATGATALTTNVITILTPLAVIGVIAVGVAAWFNKVSWGWAVAAMIGIVLVFGAQQIVTWIRGMFGV
jgi:type IV secretion system protein VirB2